MRSVEVSKTYLPHKDGVVVAACLNPEKNPDAPSVILVGTGERIESAADLLIEQSTPVPTFIKRGRGDWEFVGMYAVHRSTRDSAELASQSERSGRDDITQVIFLHKTLV